MNSGLTLQHRQLVELSVQLRKYWPNEICGYLAGVGNTVTTVLPIPNVASNRATAFLMEPQSQLNALISVEDSRSSILAVYHSHPMHALKRPSPRDLSEFTDPNCLLVVIVPDENRKIDSLRAFRLKDGKDIEVPLNIEASVGIHSQEPH